MSIDMGRYDIGVVDNQDGTYDITADWWGVETTKGVSEEEFKNQLSRGTSITTSNRPAKRRATPSRKRSTRRTARSAWSFESGCAE